MENYSVLMSVYAKENPDFLRQSIVSIQNQTVLTDDFVLVCDGPLTEELNGVISEFSDDLHVVRLQRNMGLGNALNAGLKACKNELVARMDSDDISAPDRCEKQLKAFEKDPELGIVSGALTEFTETPDRVTGERRLPCTHEEILAFSRKRCPFNHPCVMFRKSVVIEAGGYNGEFRMEDYYLWIRMLQTGCKGANLEDVLLYMRTSPDMYLRRGGSFYAKDMLRFHWWVHKTGWESLGDFLTGAVPHAVVCVLPNGIRGAVYRRLHK